MSAEIILDRHEELGKWFAERTASLFVQGQSVYIGLERDGVICAVVAFDGYKGKSICMHIAAEGKKWMSREYLWFCFFYPFEQLKVNKIIGIVESTNADAMRFDLHLGFVPECVIKDAAENGDLNILTMTKEQCRFLNIKRATPADVTERKEHQNG
jgi:hypothetical protein